MIRDQLTSCSCVKFEAGTAANIKRQVFMGALCCLKWHGYDLRGRLQILSGVMKLYCHTLAEPGLQAWQKCDSCPDCLDCRFYSTGDM